MCHSPPHVHGVPSGVPCTVRCISSFSSFRILCTVAYEISNRCAITFNGTPCLCNSTILAVTIRSTLYLPNIDQLLEAVSDFFDHGLPFYGAVLLTEQCDRLAIPGHVVEVEAIPPRGA